MTNTQEDGDKKPREQQDDPGADLARVDDNTRIWTDTVSGDPNALKNLEASKETLPAVAVALEDPDENGGRPMPLGGRLPDGVGKPPDAAAKAGQPPARPPEAARPGDPAARPVEAPRPADAPARPVEAARPADAPARPQDRPGALQGDDAKRATYLQQTLFNMAPMFAQVKYTEEELKTMKPEDRLNKAKKQIEEMQKELKDEQGPPPVFGPATQKYYQQYTEWLQRAVPETVRELDSLKLAIPPGAPIELPKDAEGRTMNPELYKALAADKELALDLQVKPGQLPTDAQLNKLDATFNWLARSNESANEARSRQRDAVVTRLIKENGLPEAWNKKPGDDPNSWRASAEEMVDLALRTRNYVEAMQSLYKASKDGDFPIDLPRGTKLIMEAPGGREKVITDQQLNDPSTRWLLKEGKIKEVQLDLPADLRQENPANAEKIQRLRQWLNDNGDRIDKSVSRLKDYQANPDAIIMFGDSEVRNGKALMDKDGNFVRLVDGRYQAKPGEQIKDCNLVGYDFQAEQVKDGPNAGKIRVTQTINAEHAPPWAYQNIRAFGVEKLGSMKVDEKFLDPDDFVPVRHGDKIEMIKAKNLASFRAAEEFAYYGEKGLSITMDVAMTATGLVEVGAALKGARIAASGAQAALRLTATEAAWEIGKGTVRVGVGAAGLFNNAGARDTNWGQTLNTARGIYFLGDVGLGLANTGWNLFRAGKAAEAMTSAQKVHTIIHGQKATETAAAINGIPFIRQAHTGGQYAFKTTEIGFVPVIAKDLSHQIDALQRAGKRDPSRDAVIQVGDGRDLQKPEGAAFDPKKPHALEAAKAVIDSYEQTLTAGNRPAETKAEVKRIMEKTKELLGPNATEEQRAQFRQELFKKMAFTPDQIKELELKHPKARDEKDFRLTDQDLRDLMDPDKRKNFPKPVAELAEKMFAEKDKDVQAAARIAMLYMARDEKGEVRPELARGQFEVPEYKKTIRVERSNGEYEDEEVTVDGRTMNQHLTTADVVADLKRDMEDPNLGNRGIATGDVLTRIGALTHREYAGVLQDVLNNKDASAEDKMRALADVTGARMGTVIDGIRLQETLDAADPKGLSRERALGKHHGVTSDALMKTLEKSAREDSNPQVRAMAAGLLYGLREQDPARRAELLGGMKSLWMENKDRPEQFATKVKELLAKDMNTSIPTDDPALAEQVRNARINAALSLDTLTPKDDPKQKEIIDAIAKSLSPTDLATSQRVLEAMMPDRIAQLRKENPQAALDFEAEAVKLLTKPETREQAAQMVDLMKQLVSLTKDGDASSRRRLASKLSDMLDPDRDQYLTHFPDMRAAAIDALAEFGDQSSVNIIRRHVTAADKLKLDDKTEIACGETDARVRMAAVRALEKLKDPQLRKVVGELVNTETDPQVASQLRDVKFLQQRIPRGSEEWKRIYEDTRKDIIGYGEKYKGALDGFDERKMREWFKEKGWDLLEKEHYKDRVKAAMDNTWSTVGGWFRSKADILADEWTAYRDVKNARDEQFKALSEMAERGGDDGARAKKALYLIMVGGGNPINNEYGLDGGRVSSTYYDNNKETHTIHETDWKSAAARRLTELAKSNCEQKDLVASFIKDGLDTKEIPGYVCDELLEGWKALGKPDKNGFAIPREELARVAVKALRRELSRDDGAKTDWYQEFLVGYLRDLKVRSVYPELQAMVDSPKHISEKARGAAKAAIDHFEHSVDAVFDDAATDTTSTPKQRADKLRQQLEDRTNTETAVEAIANAYKGYKIKDANDPGLAQLAVALNDADPKVRLAAAKVMMDSELPPNNANKQKAVQALTQMLMDGKNDKQKQEAYSYLSKLNSDKMSIMMPDGTVYKYEKAGDKMQVTEFKKAAGSDQLEVSGFVERGTGTPWRIDANTRRLYRELLGRDPDVGARWAADAFARGKTYKEVAHEAINNAAKEFRNAIPQDKEQVVPFLFQRVMGRPYSPGEDGGQWRRVLDAQGVDAVINGLMNSGEWAERHK